MTQRHSVTRWLALGLILLLVGLITKGTASAQTLAETRQQADQGHAEAQFFLGARYFTGSGVPQDYVEAHKWRNLAASRVTGDEQKEYAQTRDALAKQMTPAQLAEAQGIQRGIKAEGRFQIAYCSFHGSYRSLIIRRIFVEFD